MKLDSLVTRNFRTHQETRISLADLNSILGPNNAGKSTILRWGKN
ncbi:AAA family ATPase [Brachybacterium huguangmaarense]